MREVMREDDDWNSLMREDDDWKLGGSQGYDCCFMSIRC